MNSPTDPPVPTDFQVVRVSAPGRAGIIGNPTDGYGGSVISCSLAERATITLTPSDRFEAVVAGSHFVFESSEDWQLKGDYFDFIRATVQFLGCRNLTVRIEATTQIPVQAGLAGSTALLTSLVVAFKCLLGETRFQRHLVAETVRTIELNFLEVQCGYQDQYMTTFGGLNYMDFRDKEYYRPLEEEIFATVEPLADEVPALPFVVAHTGVKRTSGHILKPIRERWMDGDVQVVRGYRRIAALCRRAKRAFIEGDWETLAQAMNENHRIQQELGASGEENDRLIEIARRAGALGAKLAGAGGGGTIIALTLQPERTIHALREAGAVQFLSLKPSPGVTIEECR